MADTTNRILTKVELDSTQAQIEIAKLNAKASDTTKSLEERISAKNKEVKIQEQLSKQNIASLEKEIKSLRKMGASEKEVERATAKLNKEKIRATKISERNTKQNNKLNASLGKSQKSVGGLGGMFGKLGGAITSAIPALRGFKLALISTGVGAFVVAFGAAISLMFKAVKQGAEFAKSLSGLRAVIDGSNEDMARLSGQAKELGATTLFTAGEVVGLQTELAKLGFSVTEIENSTPAILDLSTALGVDLAEAAEFTGNVVRSFGLDTSETRRVVDVLAKSASSSALDFSALRESFKLAAPTARALGMSIEDTAGLLGVLADSGLKGSIAGTGLSKTLIMLRKEGLTLEEGINKVNNSSDGLVTAIDLVGIVGAKTLQTLAANAPQIEKLNKKLENTKDGAQGAAEAMAKIKADNLAGDLTLLNSAWSGFLLGLEDGSGALNDIARDGVQFLTSSLDFLGKAVDVVAFAINDWWTRAKLQAKAGGNFIGGAFKVLGGKISLFANNALLSFSKIPILGEAIDEGAVRARMAKATMLVTEGQEQLLKGGRQYVESQKMLATIGSRFAQAQAEKKARAIARIEKEASDKKLEQQKKVDEEARKQREDDLKAILKIEEDFILKQEDLEDDTKLKKLERARERKLEEIEELKLAETEKREAIKAVNDYYDQLERDEKQLLEDQEEQKKRDKLQEKADNDLLEFEIRRQALIDQRELILNDESLSEEERTRMLAQNAQDRADLKKQEVDDEQAAADAKLAIQNAALGATAQGFKLLGDLAGKNKGLQAAAIIGENAVGIATNVINTQAANAKLTVQGGIAAPALITANNIRMATGIATSVAATAKGLAALKSNSKSITGVSRPNTSGGATGSIPSTERVNDLSANNASRIGTNSSISDNATASALRNNQSRGGGSQVAFYEGTYQEFRRGIDFRDGHSTIGG